MPASRRRSFIIVPVFIALCSIAAGIMGGGASAATPSEQAQDQSLSAFSKVYASVEQNFADPVKADKAVYKGAIPGMLRTLDPHSNFFDPRDYELLREDQRGHYYGVGMQVGPRNGKTVVLAPFAG